MMRRDILMYIYNTYVKRNINIHAVYKVMRAHDYLT